MLLYATRAYRLMLTQLRPMPTGPERRGSAAVGRTVPRGIGPGRAVMPILLRLRQMCRRQLIHSRCRDAHLTLQVNQHVDRGTVPGSAVCIRRSHDPSLHTVVTMPSSPKSNLRDEVVPRTGSKRQMMTTHPSKEYEAPIVTGAVCGVH